jgi:hypothetical protein
MDCRYGELRRTLAFGKYPQSPWRKHAISDYFGTAAGIAALWSQLPRADTDNATQVFDIELPDVR